MAQTAIAVWYVFVISLCFLVACLPYFVFETVVGWQASHVALWLGTLSLAPVPPALRGLMESARALVTERGHPGRPIRRFYRAVLDATPALRALWYTVPVLILLMAYDLALYGADSSAATVAVAVAATIVGIVVIGASATSAPTPGDSLPGLVTAVLRALGRRPLVPMAWILLLVVAIAASRTPLLGPSLTLFLPGAWAAAVGIVNR
ncbi:hypothetical protein ACVMYR_32665 [Micromonospora sp. PTRAS2]